MNFIIFWLKNFVFYISIQACLQKFFAKKPEYTNLTTKEYYNRNYLSSCLCMMR